MSLGAIRKTVDYHDYYSVLFKDLQEKYGPLDAETLSSVVGFSAGGPVSLSKQDAKTLFVTCELSVYPKQRKSEEGLNYELLSVGDFTEDQCRKLLTALGNLSMNAVLGSDHTVDISGMVEPGCRVKQVQMKLFSKIRYQGDDYGIYRVVPC